MHVDHFGTRPTHADSFGSSITVYSTMTSSSSSSGQPIYTNVGTSASVDLSISGQQNMNPEYVFYDNYNASRFIQGLLTFTPAYAGTHDQHALEFNNNRVNQEQNQPYFSARINESPILIDPEPLGDNIVPSNQFVPIGMIHFLP
jgi:hypothetical protein